MQDVKRFSALSIPGLMRHSPAVTQESPIRSFHCSQCTLIFKSKVYLFRHLNEVHGFSVDAALRGAGLKRSETGRVNADNKSNSSGNNFSCRRCDFKALGQDVLNEHERQCHEKSESQKGLGNVITSDDQETKTIVVGADRHREGAVMSTSKTTCSLDSSKDLKTLKKPLQIPTITKCISGSSGKPSVILTESPDCTKGTLILQESPSSSRPNSSGVFKVTAKPMTDLSKTDLDQSLLNERPLKPDLRPPKPSEKSKETPPNNIEKRTGSESSENFPAKKAKLDQEETIIEDEDEKKVNLFNGEKASPGVYFCKHCDYSDLAIRSMSTHYQNDHPYIRYNTDYIRDLSDQSATFRCLECPVEFSTMPDLKRHYAENHPGAPKVYAMPSCELSLLFKCFVCQFTTNELKTLKDHYSEKHPKHKVDNSLLYCRYSVTGCQEGSSRLNTCERVHSPERSGGISPKNANTPYEEVKNSPAPQHLSSKGDDKASYQCKNCNFSHKSVVVMHVHYQKSHPEDAVTLDKIKQLAHATAHTTSQMTHEKLQPERTPDVSKTRSESLKTERVQSAEDGSKTKMSPTKFNRGVSAGIDSLCSSSQIKRFYCQFCSYSNINSRSVVAHHNAKHAAHGLRGTEEILLYSAEVKKKKLQSEAEASETTTSPDSKTCAQVEMCSEKELQHTEDDIADASTTGSNPYACPENLFYCQKCNFGNPTLKGVLNHQAKIHQHINTTRESIFEHTALVREEIEKSKSDTKNFSFSTHLPLPLMNDGDEDMFFCHFCNYRQNTVNHVIKHYFKRHRGFEVKAEQVHLYTAVVLEKTQKSPSQSTANQEVKGNKKEKTKMDAKCLSASASPSVRATQTQRTLQCHRCSYSSQYVYHLRKHMWKIHRSNRSVNDVLRLCFKQGMLQSGYHCDLCVFSDKNAAAVHKHYQEQHPERRLTLEYISTQLYVDSDTRPPKKKNPQTRYTDSDCSDASKLSQRYGQNETKTYSCRACSFKGSSMSSIARHYRAVHPWSVKEDGSVLNVISNKRPSVNSHVEDQDEMPVSFDTYQVPLEFGTSPGSSREATPSPGVLQCQFCPATFQTQHGLSTHCGMKHPEAATESSHDQHERQVQIQTRVHIFKCPYCTYINTNYQGVLTHCQMRHPAVVSRADSIHVDESHLQSLDEGLKRKGPDESLKLSGHMCKTCPQIYSTLEKMNKHCESDHDETVAKTVPNTLIPAPKPSAGSKVQQCNTHGTLGSVLKASSLRKRMYTVIRCQHCSYICSTKIALSRHLRLHYRNASVLKVKDWEYKCALCSKSYYRKKRLGNHYTKKHGKSAFLKYYAQAYKQGPEKLALTSPDFPLTQPPKHTSETRKSSVTTAEKIKILVYHCPSCPYVNASYHGTLTHCHMKHPAILARADDLKTDEILVTNIGGCKTGKGSNRRGYMCKKCLKIYVSLMRLKIHSERDHRRAQPAASKHSTKTETVTEPFHESRRLGISKVNTTEIDLKLTRQEQESPDTCQVLVQNKELLYKCHMCTYKGVCRRYLHCHYKNTHKLDAFSTYKLLEEYNKRKRRRTRDQLEAVSKESASVKCKECPNSVFESSQLLIAHYCTFHSSNRKSDFTVLSRESKKSTGFYKCAHCQEKLNGIRELCHHLDNHNKRRKEKTTAADSTASFVFTPAPDTTSIEICRQDELPILETVEELTQWNVTPVETFTLPTSPQSLPSKATDQEQPELEMREDKHTCKQCGRTFRSLKGLRSHERSHAALAAIKKLDNLPTSALKHNINKYVIYKNGTLRPFLCSFCSYRATVLGLWRCHFMKKHQDVLMAPIETDQDDENTQRTNEEPPNLSEENNNFPEPDEDPEMIKKSLYLEPPDVQRQLNHYSLMTQTGASSKASLQETELPENSLLHCELCNFSTGHLSSVRRHYLNRHGKKIFRCKDCNFFTGLRKTLEMHVETGHSTCQSEPTHQKDLRCPFCLYQTKNKNNMIDHIVLHREERVVPIEVRRPKLSRYLQGIVFRCHKCTFTSGSAENLRLHMTRHDDIKPYKCRLCYFDCTLLSDLEAHLSDKHQVMRNHELVGQVSLDQLQARLGKIPEEEKEPLPNLEKHNNENEDAEKKEFVTGCNEVLDKTQAENSAENDIKTLQMKEACLKNKQDPQEQAGMVFLPDAVRGQKMERIVEQNVHKGNNADIQFEEHCGPGRENQTNEDKAQPELKGSEDSSKTFTQQKEEVAEGGSSSYCKIAEKTKTQKLNIKMPLPRTSNIEARVERDILRHIVAMDEDGSIYKIRNKADQDRTVKTEQNIETSCVGKALSESLEEEGGVTLAHNPKLNSEAKKNNRSSRENFKVERHLLTLLPKCAQLKKSPTASLGVSVTRCKEEQVCNQKNSEEVTDPYGEMPVLENEYLKEVIHPLVSCKKEEDPEQNEDVVTEGNKNKCKDQENEDGDGIKETDNPQVHKSALSASGGAAEVLSPSVTEKKIYTCEFCGRNLTNSSELKRHVMRHGI